MADERWAYAIHPGVAEAGRAEAGDSFQAAVDAELAAFWEAVFQHGREQESSGGGPLIIRAGRGAAPYLMRRQRWEEASTLLEQVLSRDRSPATVAAVLPLLRRIAEATKGTEHELTNEVVLATRSRIGSLARGRGEAEEYRDAGRGARGVSARRRSRREPHQPADGHRAGRGGAGGGRADGGPHPPRGAGTLDAARSMK